MAELSYPGVYIQEQAGGPAPIQGDSPSTLGLAGFTTRGKINEPLVFTNIREAQRTIGDFTESGLLMTTLHAFFANGGSRARVVRVVGDGAANAVAHVAEGYEAVTVTGAAAVDDAVTTFVGSLSDTPIAPGTLTADHYYIDASVAAETLVATAPDGTIAVWTSGTVASGQGSVVRLSSLIGNVGIQPGSLTISWTSGSAKSMTDDGTGGFTGDGNAAGSTVNYLTGDITIDTTGDVPDAGLVSTITVAFKAVSQTSDVKADLDGTITGTNIASGTVDHETGDVSITTSKAVAASWPSASDAATPSTAFQVSYGKSLWPLDMVWPGVEGDKFSLSISGTPGSEDDDAATYTAWTVQVLDGSSVIEQYDNVKFGSDAGGAFFQTVINDDRRGSSHITVRDIGASTVPTVLSGKPVVDEVLTPSPALDGLVSAIGFTLASGSCHPTTLVISAVAVDGSVLTITDDGSGGLTGDIDAITLGSVDYATGVVAAKFVTALRTGSVVTATHYSAPAQESYTVSFEGGSDGSTVTSSNLVGAAREAAIEGLYAFNKTDEILMIGLPDFAGNEAVDQQVLDYCEARMDRFAVLALSEGMTYSEAPNYTRRSLKRGSNSYGAIYWPWISVQDPVTNKALNIPPIGHVAGVIARTDAARNVGKAPAGVADGKLRFLLGLAQSATKSQVGELNRAHVNALVDWPQTGGPVVWGARTLELNGEFKYIQARRLFMFVEKTVFNSSHLFVFEDNGPSLWTRIRLQLNSFLFRLFQQGYFAGDSPEESFFVLVDESNNPVESREAGELYVDIGIAPNSPAEFVVFRFSQKDLTS